MKVCSCCKVEKKFIFFYTHKTTKDGYGSICKSCMNLKSAQKRRDSGIPEKRTGLDPLKKKQRLENFKNKRKSYIFPEILEKLCRKCKQVLPIENFNKQVVNKDGYRNECKKCRSLNGKKTGKIYRLINWAKILVLQAKRHSNQVEIDEFFVLELFEKQNKKCYWFNVDLIPSNIEKFPNQPSLDRLDRNIGYTKENVVLACYTANIGRNITSQEVFQVFCDELLKRN